MQRGHTLKKQAISGHGLIYACRHQNHHAQKSDGGRDNAAGDQCAAGGAEVHEHRVGGRRAAGGESLYAKCAQIGEVYEQIGRRHDQHTQNERPWQRVGWIAQFFGHRIGLLPAAK